MPLTPSSTLLSYIIKPLVFSLCLLPFILLLVNIINDNLSTNPVETLTHVTGDWGLRFLLITLAVTPLRKLSGLNWLLKLRRMFGLFVFFYACLHFLTYLWFDQNFDWQAILHDIPKRPFITIGFAAFALLVPLAVTSTHGMQRRLKKNWIRLHKLVYIIAIFAVIHFIWLVKADISEPLVYALGLALLFLFRLYLSIYSKPRQTAKNNISDLSAQNHQTGRQTTDGIFLYRERPATQLPVSSSRPADERPR